MQYCYLGRSGLRVSRLCLGTFNFGRATDESEARRIMDGALEAGVNFFDTANHYPDFVHCGLSEQIIGRWFAEQAGRRERVVMATKVYQPMGNPDDPNDAAGLSKYKIIRHAEDSLRRLRTDHIDLFQMHHVDRHARWEELWEAFEVLMAQGKIGYVGSSNFAGWDLAVAQAAARDAPLFRPGQRAAQVQPAVPVAGIGGAPGRRPPGHRRTRLQSAGRRHARRRGTARRRTFTARAPGAAPSAR